MNSGALKLAVDALVEIRKRKAELSSELEELKNNERVAQEAVADAIATLADMAGVPVEEFKIPISGYNWKVNTKTFYTVPKARQDEFFAHLDAVGLGDIINRNINRSTLSKAMEDLANEEPDIMTKYNITSYNETTVSQVATK